MSVHEIGCINIYVLYFKVKKHYILKCRINHKSGVPETVMDYFSLRETDWSPEMRFVLGLKELKF
jgi:hypothetical protein